MKQPRKPNLTDVALFGIRVAALFWGFHFGQGYFLPIVCALVLASTWFDRGRPTK